MEINITLLGQMITFGVFVWFTMKFIWPYITQAMSDREKKIADGLAAAEKGQRELEAAQHKATQEIRDAKTQAAEILEQANHRANRTVEESKEQARQEGETMIQLAKQEIAQQQQELQETLKSHAAELAIKTAEKLIQHQMDEKKQQKLIDQLISKV